MILVLAVVAIAGPIDAQVPDTVPPPPDTVPPRPDTIPPPVPDTIPPMVPDTIPLRPDTVPPLRPDTLPPDTVPAEPPAPPPVLPRLDPVGPTGWAVGVWEWGREDLLRLPDLSLLHLLERIPGVTPVRATSVGQPEGAATFGATARGVRYEIDGFPLDPLTTGTFDPSRLPLVALDGVRVERRVTGTTVRIRMLSPTDPRAHSVIEAATGDFRTNLFRGTFLGPRVLGGSLAVGFESLAGEFPPPGSSNHLAGWLRWTLAREESGIQLEYRQSDTDRAGVGEEGAVARRDWVARARGRWGPVTAEGYAGATTVEDNRGDLVLREGTPQGGVRLRSELAAPVPIEALASLRLRGHPRLPAQELELAAWAYPTPWLAVGAELAQSRWDDHSPTRQLALQGRAGPLAGLSATAGLFRGDELLLLSEGPEAGPAAVAMNRDGSRAGLELQWRGLLLAAAAIRATAAPVPGFGLPFDADSQPLAGGDATGVEAVARLPTGWHPLRLEGWYLDMAVPGAWPYLPAEQWSAALVYHHLPLPSGNLEIYARGEHRFRGAMIVPGPEAPVVVGAHRTTNLELSIRVMTVHAFLRWQNMLNRPFQQDVPGFQRPGQHVLYGIKWQFWN